jgi:hypothetical protein
MAIDSAVTPAESQVVTFEVRSSRLADGTYDHQKNHEIDRGDINASYSAQEIAMENRIRKPFSFGRDAWVTVGLRGRGRVWEAEAFRLVSREVFVGTVTNYHERTGTAEAAESARNDPLGFCHGMVVKCGKELCVLCGPPARFISDAHLVADNTEDKASLQLSLF